MNASPNLVGLYTDRDRQLADVRELAIRNAMKELLTRVACWPESRVKQLREEIRKMGVEL